MASGEHYGFVFAVTYILLFSAILSTIPQDLQGLGTSPDIVTPINPNLITDFADSEQYFKGNFTDYGLLGLFYTYELPTGGTTFDCNFWSNTFLLGAHSLFLGVWLGGYDWCEFISEDGTNYGLSISFDEIDSDAEDGTVRYTLQYEDSGNSAGGFVFYWNTTTYSNSSDAWSNDELYLLHGVGLTSDTNVASLLLSLLLLQVPEVPFLISVILIGPLWASIIYVVWVIIIAMIPFLNPP